MSRRKYPRKHFATFNVDGLEARCVPAAFGAGNIAVVRVGDGVAAPGTTAAKVFIDEYTASGTLVQSIPISSTGATALTVTGNSSTEAHMNRSLDGQYLVLGGYRADAGSAAPTTTAGVARVIGRLDAAGTVDTSTAFSDGYTGTNIRDVTTDNGSRFWTAGAAAANGGLRFVATLGGTTSVNLTNNAGDNLRTVDVGGTLAAPTLYLGAGAAIPGRSVYQVGTAGTLPTSGTQTYTATFAPPASGTTNDFVFADLSPSEPGDDTLYVAPGGTTNGIYKYTKVGGVWNASGSIAQTVDTTMAGFVSGSNVTLFTLTSTGSANSIRSLTDSSGYNGTMTGSFTSIATAGVNTVFRGLAMTPQASNNPNTSTAITSISPLTVNIGDNVTLQASVMATSGSNTPVGSVEFRNGATLLASAPLTGSGLTATASVTTNTIPFGSYSNITAVFVPTGAFNPSTSPVFGSTLNVNAIVTTTALTSNAPNPSPGATVTFTATVSGSTSPVGTVDFFANGTKLNDTSITLAGGVATIMVPTDVIQAFDGKTLTPGVNDISAVYNPTGIFLSSNTGLAQKVKPNAFTQGNILVYRAGDGLNTMTANGNRFYIDEYAPGAGQIAPVQSIIMPTIADGSNLPVLASGVQSRDGQLALSPDGQYVYFPAYNALPTNATNITFATATQIPRVVGRLNLVTGAIDTSMALTDVASTGAFRSVAVAADGSIYATGAIGGIRYVPAYSAATTTSTNLGGTLGYTSVNIFGSPAQLYASALPSTTVPGTTPKLATIGTGLPTSGTPTQTAFAGISPDNTSSPQYPTDFYLADLSATVAADASGVDTLYIVQDGNFTAGTITKWSWDATGLTWVSNGSISPPPGGFPGVDDSFSGLTGVTSSGNVSLVISLGAGGTNNGGGSIWSITDTAGYNAAFSTTTLTVVAQAGLGSLKAFRGVAVVPTPTVPSNPVVTGFIVNGGAAQRSRLTTIQVNFAAPVNAADFQTAGAITLTRTGVPTAGTAVVGTVVNTGNGLIVSPATGMVSSLTLTFANTQNAGVAFGSLADGRWQLGVPGASYLSPNSPTDTQLRRLFGNENNDTLVDANDFGFFPPFGATAGSIFDFNNDGDINASDLGEFGNRYGITLV